MENCLYFIFFKGGDDLQTVGREGGISFESNYL